MAALTLTQYLLMSNDPLIQAIVFSLIENGSVMQDIPFKNKKTLIANGTRFEGNLPTVDWVKLNTPGPTTSGTPTPFQESAYLIRNNIDVDKALVEDENQIADPRAVQLGAYLKSVAYDMNDKFINNNHVDGNSDSLVGLKARIDDGAKYGVRSENKINGGAVDLRLANRTAKSFAQFLELIDQLLWSVGSPDGTGVVIYLNETMQRRWDSAAKEFAGNGGFSQGMDQLDRSITRYKNAVIRDIGRKADQETKIITSTEAADGTDPGNSTYTSIYAVRYGEEHLGGWQYEPMAGKDLGLLEGGHVYRTNVDWVGGLYPATNRCMARVYGVRLA